MKKIAISAVFIAFICVIPMRAHGSTSIGVMLGEPTGLSIRFDHFPVLGLAWSVKSDWMYIQADYWFLQTRFSSPLSFYIGGGAALSISSSDVGIGARLPVGLMYGFHRHFELFGELAPGISVVPDIGNVGLGGVIGLRYIF